MRSVLKYPLITEKSARLQGDQNQYCFVVDRSANKLEIKKAVEALKKNVEVESVSTMIVRGKVKRMGLYSGKRPNWKKAVVKLKSGQSLEFMESA